MHHTVFTCSPSGDIELSDIEFGDEVNSHTVQICACCGEEIPSNNDAVIFGDIFMSIMARSPMSTIQGVQHRHLFPIVYEGEMYCAGTPERVKLIPSGLPEALRHLLHGDIRPLLALVSYITMQ